jgi:hypothetical protein
MINAAGDEMLLCVIRKGTTRRCKSRFQSHFRHAIAEDKLILCHQSSGWTDKTVATSVIDWLSKCVNRRPHCLLLDVFTAQWDGNVKQHAPTRNTNLIFVPAGTIDKHEPLDQRIFGNLKSRSRP